MDYDLLFKALEAAQRGQGYAFATVIESTLKGTPRKTGAKMIVLEDGTLFGTIGGGRYELSAQKECLKAIRLRKPTLATYNYFGEKGQSICGGQIKVFIEPFQKQKHLIICGAGHIGLALSFIGKMLGYKITVIDNRRAFADKKRFPHADCILAGSHARRLAEVPIDRDTHIMIATQGNEYDFECLQTALKFDMGYLGVISSRAKRVKFFHRLKAAGVSQKLLNKIKIPAGIDIGAQTPAELAVSIAAEMIAVSNKNFTGTDKFLEKQKITRGKDHD